MEDTRAFTPRMHVRSVKTSWPAAYGIGRILKVRFVIHDGLPENGLVFHEMPDYVFPFDDFEIVPEKEIELMEVNDQIKEYTEYVDWHTDNLRRAEARKAELLEGE
jgi:hypothetical protein